MSEMGGVRASFALAAWPDKRLILPMPHRAQLSSPLSPAECLRRLDDALAPNEAVITGGVRDGVFRGMLRWERPYGARRQCVVTARFSPGEGGGTLLDLRFAERAQNRFVFVFALVFLPAYLGLSLFRLASPHATRQDLLFPIMGAIIAFMVVGVFAMTRAIARTEQGLIIDFLKRTVQAT